MIMTTVGDEVIVVADAVDGTHGMARDIGERGQDQVLSKILNLVRLVSNTLKNQQPHKKLC
jgi:hypothetical protein